MQKSFNGLTLCGPSTSAEDILWDKIHPHQVQIFLLRRNVALGPKHENMTFFSRFASYLVKNLR